MECNFTYEHYIETVKKYKPSSIFLRHDVDMSLDKALEMARVEKENGITSIYFILLTNPYYNPLARIDDLKELIKLGHGIGIHYDYGISQYVTEQADLLENILHTEIDFSSMHNPTLGTKPTEKDIEDMEITDCTKLNSKYISDSGRNWREGCFCQHVGKHDFLQINTHPEWWGKTSDEWFLCYNKIRKSHYINTDKLYDNAINNLRNYYDILGIRGDR